MGWLFLLFALLPVAELWLLFQIGGRIGALPTIAIVIGTGALGAFLAKREGLKVLRQWRETVARGQLPEEGLTGAALVLVGGILLLTPGVLTDVAGVLCLLPPTRRAIARVIKRRIDRAIQRGTLRVQTPADLFGRPGEREVQGEAKVRPRGDDDKLPR